MKKMLLALVATFGVPALLGLGTMAVGMTVAADEADAYCYTRRTRYCYYSYGRRYCRYRTYRRCTRTRRCFWRRSYVRRRYCRYRYGSRYCYYRSYWRRYRVCR